jgi:hydrogenase nickel incorporation protein HypA/HybF
MHEFSLVRSLLAQLPEILPRDDWHRLRVITLAAGPLSGFEPLLASEAFEQLKIGSGLDACRLEIEQEALRAQCRDCGHPFDVEAFRFRCPNCASARVDVISGESVRIATVTLVQTNEPDGRVSAETVAGDDRPPQDEH